MSSSYPGAVGWVERSATHQLGPLDDLEDLEEDEAEDLD